jgi:hypothetical protein
MAKQSIAHVGGKGETAAQDAFAATLAKAYAEKSGKPAPAPVDNSAWKPAQVEAPKPRFPVVSVVICLALMVTVVVLVVMP